MIDVDCDGLHFQQDFAKFASESNLAPFLSAMICFSLQLPRCLSLLGDDQKFICIFYIGTPSAVLQSFYVSAASSSMNLHDFAGLEDDDDFVWSRDFLVRCETKGFVQTNGFHLVVDCGPHIRHIDEMMFVKMV